MLEYNAHADAENTARIYQNLPDLDASHVSPPLQDRNVVDSRVEDYLDHIIAPIVGKASYAARQEMLFVGDSLHDGEIEVQ